MKQKITLEDFRSLASYAKPEIRKLIWRQIHRYQRHPPSQVELANSLYTFARLLRDPTQ